MAFIRHAGCPSLADLWRLVNIPEGRLRQIAFETAAAHLSREGVDFDRANCLDVGGTRELCMELPTKAGGKRRGLRDATLRLFGETLPFDHDIIIAANPVLTLFQNVTLLDQGFNKSEYGTNMDLMCDFLDPSSIENLEGKYEVVVSFDTLEHVRDPFLFCRHMVQCAKPGGLIYVSTVFLCPYHPSPFDYFRFSPDGLKECFAGVNVNVIAADWDQKELGVFIIARKDL